MTKELDDRLTPAAFRDLPRDSFVGWLHRHGLLCSGGAWEIREDAVTGTPVFRRRADIGKHWPADRIPGALIVRPKRNAA